MRLKLKEILWPGTCPFCGNVSADGICPDCRKRTDRLLVREPRCMKCGKPVRYAEQEYCRDCLHTYHYYDRGVAMWLHKEPVSKSVYRFKYQNQRFYAELYAREISAKYGALIQRWAPEVIVPVPLHPGRRRKRGYNQTEILAEELGNILQIPVSGKLVRRVRDTKPQKILDNRERRQNLRKAFVQGASSQGPERVLIVDDIYTTGSTVDAVAKVLRTMGVQKVYFLTISIGQGY